MVKLAAVIFAVLALAPAIGGAQEYSDDVCPAKPAAEKRAQRWAGRWFVKGEQAVKKAQFQEALDAFLCSLYLSPHRNTVFNVAQLTNLVEDKAAATASLKQFREQHPGGEFDDELSDLVTSLERAQGILPPEPVAPPPAEEPQPAPVAPEDGTTKANKLRAAGIVSVSVSGAALVVGIVLAAAAGSAKRDAENAPDYDTFQASEKEMKGLGGGAAAMFVMTGVLAGAGALMIALGRRGESEKEDGAEEAVEVEVAPGPVGLTITGRF
ncbi:MAG: hypothetical protein M0R80_24935 [Proteobacteria bacterium]|nr:hypothetical protein [Pseudomonadota bacterium]